MVVKSVTPSRVPHVFEEPGVKAIAAVYAEALLGVSGEPAGTQRVEELGDFIVNVLDAHPQLETLLTSPRITQSEKLALLERAVLPHASPFFANFLKVLASRDRLELLRAIHVVSIEQLETQLGQRRVQVRAASQLSDDEVDQIRRVMQQKLTAEPVLHVEIDPSLIGGLIIQVGDTVYDSSLRNRLGQLHSRLRQRYVHEIQSGRDRFSHPEGD